MDVMELRRGLMMQSAILLPSGYRFIEYAENTGSAYVDLPFGFDKTDEIKTLAAIKETTSDKFVVAPNTWNDNSNRFAIVGICQGYFAVGYGSYTTYRTGFSHAIGDSLFHTWTYKDYMYSITDLSKKMDVTSILFGGATKNLRLFYGYNASCKGKIAYYWHKKGNVEYNIRPIENILTGDVEMYDTVSKTIMQRTGTLLAPST